MSNALPVPPPAAVRTAYHEELNEGQRSALLSWLSFTGTFALTRGITYSIRAGRGPFRNLSAGGAHLHHYLWGIGMLAVGILGEAFIALITLGLVFWSYNHGVSR